MEPVQGAALGPLGIEIRHCHTLADYEECVHLEDITWGESILVPSAIFVVAEETGGQILGAFAGKELVGFTLAMAGVRDGRPFLHSHMTAVLEAFWDRGVGRGLKLFQRLDALSRGIDLVEWTFDPLEIKNAHFNFTRLGAIARRLIPNCYGITESPLHANLPTDRLVAEWWLDSPRVKSILAGTDSASNKPAHENSVKISLPSDIGELRVRDRRAAERIQAEVREQFQRRFAGGYVSTAIAIRGNKAEYILQPAAYLSAEAVPAIGISAPRGA